MQQVLQLLQGINEKYKELQKNNNNLKKIQKIDYDYIHCFTTAFNSNYNMRVDNILNEIVKWWKDKQLKKKILAYKAKFNEQRER